MSTPITRCPVYAMCSMAVLAHMDTHFDRLYSAFGRESIPPEKLVRALMLQVLFE
jgi:hypothetical protein